MKIYFTCYINNLKTTHKQNNENDSGCGSVGRVVASDTRGLQFESSHRQNFIHVFTINCIEKTKLKKKRPGMAHLKNITKKF